MARYGAGGRTTAGSTTLPIFSLYAAASYGGVIREIGVSNSTTTAVTLGVRRMTTAGTQGTAESEIPHDPARPAAQCTAVNTHSSTGPTLTAGWLAGPVVLGAAAGAGWVWTFGAEGLVIPAGTGNGIGVIPNGTGQACDVYILWDE